jgi:hypothetical protein
MFYFLSCLISLSIGVFLGWKFTARRERMCGYAEAINDQYKQIRVKQQPTYYHKSTNLRLLKGNKL